MSDNNIPSHHGIGDTPNKEYPNKTIKLLHERSSCRSFYDKAIPDDVLNLVLEAGLHSATGGNLQPYSIIKITDKSKSKELGELCGQAFIGDAPVNLLFCIDFHRIKRWANLAKAPFSASNSFRHFWISFQDTIIAAQNICTAADAVDLGSVYIGTVIEFVPKAREMFDLPNQVFPVVLLCLGYPKARPKPKKKLGISSIIHNEKYIDNSDEILLEDFKNKYPDLKVEITAERLQQIEKVCLTVHGKEFAEKCLAEIKKTGYINPVQRYFGLHYVADKMPLDNLQFLSFMKEAGFNWLEGFKFGK